MQCVVLIGMDALIELDVAVSRLLARYEALLAENARLKAEIAVRSQCVNHLEEEVAQLRSAMADEANLRKDACARLEALIGHINKYTCQR